MLAMAPSLYGFGVARMPRVGTISGGVGIPAGGGFASAKSEAVGPHPTAASVGWGQRGGTWLKERIRDGKRKLHMQVRFGRQPPAVVDVDVSTVKMMVCTDFRSCSAMIRAMTIQCLASTVIYMISLPVCYGNYVVLRRSCNAQWTAGKRDGYIALYVVSMYIASDIVGSCTSCYNVAKQS